MPHRQTYRSRPFKNLDPITYQDIMLTVSALAAIYAALAVSPIGPHITGRARTLARRAIRHLRDDAARIKSYAEQLSGIVNSHRISGEPLDVDRGHIKLTRARLHDLRDARNNIMKAVQCAFKHSDDLIDFFESEGGPIDKKLQELSNILNDVIKSDTYGEATAKLIATG